MNQESTVLLDRHENALCYGAQNRVHIEIDANGFSLCRSDQFFTGDYLIGGIQKFDVANELTEMLIGELEDQALEAQQNSSLVFG